METYTISKNTFKEMLWKFRENLAEISRKFVEIYVETSVWNFVQI